MPLLFALGVHDALAEVAAQLLPGEDLCAFLDDVYALCAPHRVRIVYDLLRESLWRHAGIELHSGKTRVWNRAGVQPPNIADLGGEGAWSPQGIKIHGAPVGTDEVIQELTTDRLQEEKELLSAVTRLPDPQCAWQLLTRCCVPRGTCWLRVLPPLQAERYASRRDVV